jgi:hypothetical protein
MNDMLDIHAMTALRTLRAATLSGSAGNGAPIVPGLSLGWDTQDGQVAIDYETSEGVALSLTVKVSGTPRWLSMNLDLAHGRIEPGDVLGLVVEGCAEGGAKIGPRLRTWVEGERIDCDWDDAIALHAENDVRVALRSFEAVDGITGKDGYHSLILRLPKADKAITIRSIGLFLVPGSRDLPRASQTLSELIV